jgi:hypothetical protein
MKKNTRLFSFVLKMNIVTMIALSCNNARSFSSLKGKDLQKHNSKNQKSGQQIEKRIIESQVVIINDNFRYIEIENGQISIKKTGDPELKYNAYSCGNRIFPMSWDVSLRHLREMTVKSRLSIKQDSLYFDGKQINLEKGLKMREIWDAISWHGWIICLGRTSASDMQANLRPPFLSNELITFKAESNTAQVRWLSAFAPADEGGFILLDEIPCK